MNNAELRKWKMPFGGSLNPEWVAGFTGIRTGIESTAKQTITMVQEIKAALMDYKHRIRKDHKFYSQDLINNLFFHPYTKIEFIENDLKVSRLTATKYLDVLAEDGFLRKEKIGRSNYYINTALYSILTKEYEESQFNQ